MSSISERIQGIIDERFNHKSAPFARTVGFSPQTVANYLNPKRASKPTSDFLEAVVRIVKVNAYWLLTGERQMFDEANTDELSKPTPIGKLQGAQYNLKGGQIEIFNLGDEHTPPDKENDQKKDEQTTSVEKPEDYHGLSIADLLATIAAKEAHIERLLGSLEKRDSLIENLMGKL